MRAGGLKVLHLTRLRWNKLKPSQSKIPNTVDFSRRIKNGSLHDVESVNKLNEEDIPRFAFAGEGGRRRRRRLLASLSAVVFFADSQGRASSSSTRRPWAWLRRQPSDFAEFGGATDTEYNREIN
nr:hypothetical protein Itr_chr11CG22620 [Ipomoea trifida]